MLEISHKDVVLHNVRVGQLSSQIVTFKNPVGYPLSFTIRPSSKRWTVTPSDIEIPPGGKIDVKVQLLIMKELPKRPHRKRIRDVFQIRSEYFTQKMFGMFHMAENQNQVVDTSKSPPRRIHRAANQVARTPNLRSKLKAKKTTTTSTGRTLNMLETSGKSVMNKPVKTYVPQRPTQKDLESTVEIELLTAKIRYLETKLEQATVNSECFKTIEEQLKKKIPDVQTIVESSVIRERALVKIEKQRLYQDRTEQERKYKSLESLLDEARAEISMLNVDIASSKAQIVDLRNSNQELRTKVHEQAETLEVESRNSSRKSKSLQLEIKDVQEALELKLTETEKLRSRYKIKFDEWGEMQQKYIEEVTELKRCLKDKSVQLGAVERDQENEKTRLEAMGRRIVQLEDELKKVIEENSRFDLFKRKLDQVKNYNDDIVGGNEIAIYRLKIDLAESRTLLEISERKVRQLADGKGIKISSSEEVTELRKSLAKKNAHLANAERRIGDLTKQLEKLETLHRSAQQKFLSDSERFNLNSQKWCRSNQELSRYVELCRKQIYILNSRLKKAVSSEQRCRVKLKTEKDLMKETVGECKKNIQELEAALEAVTAVINNPNKDAVKEHDLLEAKKQIVQLVNANKWNSKLTCNYRSDLRSCMSKIVEKGKLCKEILASQGG